MKHPNYPGVTSMTDRHGKTRYTFRKLTLPGEPHTLEFDTTYLAAIEALLRLARKEKNHHGH